MEITINGIKTNCQVFGEGKPFLILHGWGSNSERWREVAEIISQKGFKVLLLDLPGLRGLVQVETVIWKLKDGKCLLVHCKPDPHGLANRFYLEAVRRSNLWQAS